MITKKWLIIISGLLLVYSVTATTFIDGKQYTRLKRPVVTEQSQVLSFFSFYCLHCYQLEEEINIFDKLKGELPKDIEIKKYHVGFWGPLGNDLTRAWSLAITLGIEDKVLLPMFKAIQRTNKISDVSDIRSVFIDAAGIKEEDYDKAWDSFATRYLVIQQNKAVEDFRPQGVPAIFINGIFQVNLQRLYNGNIDTFIRQCVELIKYLMKKNHQIVPIRN